MPPRKPDPRKRRQITVRNFVFSEYSSVFKGRLNTSKKRDVPLKMQAYPHKKNKKYEKVFFIDRWIPSAHEEYIGKFIFEGKQLYFYEDKRKKRGTSKDRKDRDEFFFTKD